MPTSMQAGDVLAARYRLDDLLAENGTGRFFRAHDLVLHRPVSVHVLAADDERAEAVLAAPIIQAVSHLLKVAEFRHHYSERPASTSRVGGPDGR